MAPEPAPSERIREDDDLEGFRRYRADGGRDLRNRLVEANLDLVDIHVSRYRGRAASEDDLRQVAGLALVKAVERFDPDHGVKFATFAGRTIDGTLKRHFRDRTWGVRPPRRAQELYLEVRDGQERLAQELGRSPTVTETAHRLGLTEEEVLEGTEAAEAYRSTSIDRRADPDTPEQTPALDRRLATHEAGFHHSEIRVLVEQGLNELPERQRDALRMRFVDDMTQDEIAQVLGVSQSYLSRLLRKALAELRSHLDG